MANTGVTLNQVVTTGSGQGVNEKRLLLIGRSEKALDADGVADGSLGEPVIVKSLYEAYTRFGTDTSYGNYLPAMIEEALKPSSIGAASSSVVVVSIGKNTIGAISTTTDGATVKGTDIVNVADATGITTGTVIAIGAGNTQEIVTVASVSTNELTLEEKLSMPHATAEAVVDLTIPADSLYTNGLNQCLSDGVDNIEAVVCDSQLTTVLNITKAHCITATEDYDKRRYMVTSTNRFEDDASNAIAIATDTGNSERVFVAAFTLVNFEGIPVPPAVTATAIAKMAVSQKEPQNPIHTWNIQGYAGFLHNWSNPELDALGAGGVNGGRRNSGQPVLDSQRMASYPEEAPTNLVHLAHIKTTDRVAGEVITAVEPFLKSANSSGSRESVRVKALQKLESLGDSGIIYKKNEEVNGEPTIPTATVELDPSDSTKVLLYTGYFILGVTEKIEITQQVAKI